MTTAPQSASLDLGQFAGTLVLLGAGKMGTALMQGWLGLGLDPAKIIVIEPQPADELRPLEQRGVRVNPKTGAAKPATAIVLAVKPQIAAEALPALTPWIDTGTLVVSIMAGRTLAFLAGALPEAKAIVRSMPNTPAAIGRGITVAVAAKGVTPMQRETAHRLLAATGAVEWVADEALLDAVTAVSGSGPAYVFLLVESLARAGVAAGLPAPLAARLARDTVAGSGELLHRSPLEASTLRENVTSPGGTTAAALSVLMAANGLDPLMDAAVAAATRRSRELGRH